MKKIVLTGATLFALATATYAQVIQQVGQQQFAQQNQFGANQNGTINQVQNAVDPNRSNYGNYAITFQGTPNNTGANTLVINQNDGSQGNRAGIGQSGGPNNSATINQNGGINGLSGGATSVSATIGARGEDGNFAGISQIGAANTALINENNNSRRNGAETYQNGNGNTATTNQSNNSVSNTAFVYQGFSSAGVTATAVNNAVATIQQGKNSAGDVSTGAATPEAVGNTAVITQTASNVTAQIFQGGITGVGSVGRADGNRASISQTTVNNAAQINQGVDGGESIQAQAAISQANTANVSTFASIFQGVGASGSNQGGIATISQAGSGFATVATINQGYYSSVDGSQASITQSSSVVDGIATINQGLGTFGTAGGSYSTNDKAAITQGGSANSALINQNGTDQVAATGQSNGRDNNATIAQAAAVSNSFAVIDQGYVSVAGSVLQTNRNTASVTQSAGTGHLARISQGRVGTPEDALNNTLVLPGSLNGVAVTLVGTVTNDNTASVTQSSGTNHNANVFQNGRFNTASVTQANGNAHQALVVQTANSQRASATISQTSTGTGNAATIYQFAGSNADGQGAFGNIASISQMAGSNNIAFIQQGLPGASTSSNDNVASVTQNGSGNFARFLQVGNNNMVNITQNGNNNQVLNLAGDPGSYGSQQGYNNRLTLVQEGGNTGVTFKYTQIGNNNTQVVNQHF
jgi:hypothetical protein